MGRHDERDRAAAPGSSGRFIEVRAHLPTYDPRFHYLIAVLEGQQAINRTARQMTSELVRVGHARCVRPTVEVHPRLGPLQLPRPEKVAPQEGAPRTRHQRVYLPTFDPDFTDVCLYVRSMEEGGHVAGRLVAELMLTGFNHWAQVSLHADRYVVAPASTSYAPAPEPEPEPEPEKSTLSTVLGVSWGRRPT